MTIHYDTIDTLIMSATFIGTCALGALRLADKRWLRGNVAEPVKAAKETTEASRKALEANQSTLEANQSTLDSIQHFTTANGHKNDPMTLRDVTATILTVATELNGKVDGLKSDITDVRNDVARIDTKYGTETDRLWTALAQRPGEGHA